MVVTKINDDIYTYIKIIITDITIIMKQFELLRELPKCVTEIGGKKMLLEETALIGLYARLPQTFNFQKPHKSEAQ